MNDIYTPAQFIILAIVLLISFIIWLKNKIISYLNGEANRVALIIYNNEKDRLMSEIKNKSNAIYKEKYDNFQKSLAEEKAEFQKHIKIKEDELRLKIKSSEERLSTIENEHRIKLAAIEEKIRLKNIELKNIDIVFANLLKKEKIALAEKERKLQEKEIEYDKLFNERTIAFPYLADMYAKYKQAKLEYLEHHLRYKQNRALKSAEAVALARKQLRESEKENFMLEGQIKYYESLVPDLVEMIGFPTEVDNQNLDDTEEQDAALKFLKSEEWNSLSNIEKYQLALDRYWEKKKTKWEIGRMYERFIGYEYEIKGWDVTYFGAIKGLEDMGRDLIVKKNDNIYIIQCKNWASEKTIHEKHILQLYGTCILYECETWKKPKGKFITSCKLSDVAKDCANLLHIDVIENKKLEKYPCIKCNIGKNNTFIYHLPFDQQYDKVKIKKSNGDLYCSTIMEAEAAGFRRAHRWRGGNANGQMCLPL